LTIQDFMDYCEKKKIRIEQKYFLGKSGLIHFLPNLLAQNALFVLTHR
jgi:Methionine biosynthesis protein MetW